jgi:hypothetical protein
MQHQRHICLVLLLLALPSAASDVVVQEPDVHTMLKKCEVHLEALQQQADTARLLSNTFLLLGAAVAGVGSALAGFLTKTGIRKVMAIVGAVGAVLAVVPKTLKDPSEIVGRRMAGERHRIVAAKVVLQLAYLTHDKDLAKQYAINRIVDCLSAEPPETVPPLPTPPKQAGSDTPAAGDAGAGGQMNSEENLPIRPARWLIAGGYNSADDGLPPESEYGVWVDLIQEMVWEEPPGCWNRALVHTASDSRPKRRW